ncbi:MAG: ribosome small subunit-dependent GTPase A [Clostridiales bacterium]|mgnify:CR=1 FL=1|nr:ribosome small subunit-dependent GTPase A [Clostridiales bacterium]
MIDISDYGYNGVDKENIARVTAVHKERYEMVCSHGEVFGRLKGSVYYSGSSAMYPTTGDFVKIQFNGQGDSLITQTLPRSSKFSRSNLAGHAEAYVKTVQEQVVAANFDYVFILASLNRDFSPRRIERYAALAWQSGAQPVILLTKADLKPDHTEELGAAEHAAPGVPAYAVSSRTGYGLKELDRYFAARKTAVFLGSSGVGKSSLLNALAGEQIMSVKEIREDDSRGRHTTTHRQLIMLKSGAMIIDTPGMRELGLWAASEGLVNAFSDVESVLLRPCRFNDCRHESEPGCSVKAATESGELSRERWDSYMALKREARFADDKAAALKEKNEFFKSIAKAGKEKKKNGMLRE